MIMLFDRLGRLLLALLFLAGAAQKGIDPAPAQALLADWGLPVWLIWPALVFNAVGALCLISGVWLGPVALALAGYCAVTSLFHFIPSDPWQMSILVKNLAIAGGLLCLAARAMSQTDARNGAPFS
ncbi:DoxX family membrane protein [Sulfitobacter albidus]|uniref:DoxX family membrane protein n=1 Tax=Sulfitobacter albidus TaxID=2829501 RepID=A0A975JBG2_9RHOB|nr:DoxX family membrane protein [Sulfitobacter albidus]QUJ75358.1 DoxX family membrane protein [Sulfitobacter albidus]